MAPSLAPESRRDCPKLAGGVSPRVASHHGISPGRGGRNLSWQIIPSILSEMLDDKDPEKSARVWQAMIQSVKMDIAALKRAYEGS